MQLVGRRMSACKTAFTQRLTFTMLQIANTFIPAAPVGRSQATPRYRQ